MKLERQSSPSESDLQEIDPQECLKLRRKELLTSDGEFRSSLKHSIFTETLYKIKERTKTYGTFALSTFYLYLTWEAQLLLNSSEKENLSFDKKTILTSSVINIGKLIAFAYEPTRLYIALYESLILSMGTGMIFLNYELNRGEKKK